MFNLRKEKKELPENTKEIGEEINKIKKENELLKKEIKEIKEKQKLSIQKVEMERFNPFHEEGGNQSFSTVFLDGNKDGIVITALYTKEGSRIYGKPIKNGVSEFSLSGEEKKIIKNVCGEDKKNL